VSEVVFRVAREWDVVKVKISTEVEKRVVQLRAEGKCLGCEEPLTKGERVSRGLCMTCYHGARYAMKRRRTSEAQLLREGRLLEQNPGGRKPANKFTRELSGR
jgi:hypothetical protein